MTELTDPTTADAAAERIVWGAFDDEGRLLRPLSPTSEGAKSVAIGGYKGHWSHTAEPYEWREFGDGVPGYGLWQGGYTGWKVRSLPIATGVVETHDFVDRNEQLRDDRDAARREARELRDAVTVATELIDRLAFDDECSLDHHGCCQAHSVQPPPCPHPLGRRFVEAWGTQASAMDGADREGAQKASQSHGDAISSAARPPG